MTFHFGPMASSDDGIDRVEVKVPFRLSREDIVTIVADHYDPGERPTKAEIYETCTGFLAEQGLEGLRIIAAVSPIITSWTTRYAWANQWVSRQFSGWNERKAS